MFKTSIVYDDIADHVHCNYCDLDIYVEVGTDVCPHCKYYGYLQWVNEEHKEVKVNGKVRVYRVEEV